MIRKTLELNTKKALATMARRQGVDGWHEMRTTQVESTQQSILDAAKSRSQSKAVGSPASSKSKRSSATQSERPTPHSKHSNGRVSSEQAGGSFTRAQSKSKPPKRSTRGGGSNRPRSAWQQC